ncbi:DUF2726 domain-containing protein [Conchiformibius steedae]|uniref:DUF2726 domain-containing protein n=1 Tax=Conchiformibius steedae TaxID=153493 RepID=A0A3P2A0Q0_9NEIS|nr:DUF2726 domain-containing protein [Conchiformibius steedae]RRD88984.1 DUF2726 domain-containing protein [Conchiformibius steedae]
MAVWLAGLAVLLVVAVWAGRRAWQNERGSAASFGAAGRLPYRVRPLMTPTELKVYDRLLRALPEHMIFTQVQVSRVLEAPAENNRYWFNLICRLSYDFVVCDLDGVPIAAIEIDDATHNLPERMEADQRKNRATEDAGIAILRWPVHALPNVRQIRQIIARCQSSR